MAYRPPTVTRTWLATHASPIADEQRFQGGSRLHDRRDPGRRINAILPLSEGLHASQSGIEKERDLAPTSRQRQNAPPSFGCGLDKCQASSRRITCLRATRESCRPCCVPSVASANDNGRRTKPGCTDAIGSYPS